MWTLARLVSECTRHGIDPAEAIAALGLAHVYHAETAAEWIGLT